MVELESSKRQLIFDTVYNGLWEQNEPSVDEYNSCVYFNEKTGNKCAAGQLIAPGEYTPDFEDKPVVYYDDKYDGKYDGKYDNNITRYFLDKYDNDRRYLKLIDDLQLIHDTYIICCSEESFRKYINDKFCVYAEQHDLRFVSRGE